MSGRHRRETPDPEKASDNDSDDSDDSDDDFDAGETGAQARAQHD